MDHCRFALRLLTLPGLPHIEAGSIVFTSLFEPTSIFLTSLLEPISIFLTSLFEPTSIFCIPFLNPPLLYPHCHKAKILTHIFVGLWSFLSILLKIKNPTFFCPRAEHPNQTLESTARGLSFVWRHCSVAIHRASYGKLKTKPEVVCGMDKS